MTSCAGPPSTSSGRRASESPRSSCEPTRRTRCGDGDRDAVGGSGLTGQEPAEEGHEAGWRSTRSSAASGASPASRSDAATTSHECRACSLSRKPASVAMSIGSGRKGSDGRGPESWASSRASNLSTSRRSEIANSVAICRGAMAFQRAHTCSTSTAASRPSATASSVSRPISAPLPRCDSTWARSSRCTSTGGPVPRRRGRRRGRRVDRARRAARRSSGEGRSP